MIQRILLFLFAAAQFICANLSLSYRVSVDGREVPGTFSRAELERIGIVSCAANPMPSATAPSMRPLLRPLCSMMFSLGPMCGTAF